MAHLRELKQISSSSLDRFTQCPLSYYHQYLNEDRPAQEGVAMFYAHFGTLIHMLSEMYPRLLLYKHFPYKVSNKEPKDVDSLVSMYADLMYERGEPITADNMMAVYDKVFPYIQFPDSAKQEEYYKQGADYVRSLPDKDWTKVIGLEQEFRLELPETSPLIGFIDKVERDDKGIIVTDYKTSKPYSANAIKAKNQLPIYGLACYILYGEFPYKYRYDFVRFGKVVEVSIPDERLRDVQSIIKFKETLIRSYMQFGEFPSQYSSFYCKNFCGFSRLCEVFKAFNQ